MTKISKMMLPFFFLFLLLALLWRALFVSNQHAVPSALIGETIPTFAVPNLQDPIQLFTQNDLPKRAHLLNVWATWCTACIMEAPMLLKISRDFHVPIYSINYKGDVPSTRAWLEKHGNPYVVTGIDGRGDATIDLGVYATPATFVVSPYGKIIYRHVGVIDQATWDNVIYPLIKQYG